MDMQTSPLLWIQCEIVWHVFYTDAYTHDLLASFQVRWMTSPIDFQTGMTEKLIFVRSISFEFPNAFGKPFGLLFFCMSSIQIRTLNFLWPFHGLFSLMQFSFKPDFVVSFSAPLSNLCFYVFQSASWEVKDKLPTSICLSNLTIWLVPWEIFFSSLQVILTEMRKMA